jgi:hypothetical protein
VYQCGRRRSAWVGWTDGWSRNGRLHFVSLHPTPFFYVEMNQGVQPSEPSQPDVAASSGAAAGPAVEPVQVTCARKRRKTRAHPRERNHRSVREKV